jgi:hypothetical protein
MFLKVAKRMRSSGKVAICARTWEKTAGAQPCPQAIVSQLLQSAHCCSSTQIPLTTLAVAMGFKSNWSYVHLSEQTCSETNRAFTHKSLIHHMPKQILVPSRNVHVWAVDLREGLPWTWFTHFCSDSGEFCFDVVSQNLQCSCQKVFSGLPLHKIFQQFNWHA